MIHLRMRNYKPVAVEGVFLAVRRVHSKTVLQNELRGRSDYNMLRNDRLLLRFQEEVFIEFKMIGHLLN